MPRLASVYLEELVQLLQLAILRSELGDDSDSVRNNAGFVGLDVFARI